MLKRVYAAEYCSCVYESGFEVISLHSTISGAYKAMKEHKLDEYYSCLRNPYLGKGYKVTDYQRWRFRILKVQD